MWLVFLLLLWLGPVIPNQKTVRISLCSPGYPGTHYLDQTNLELTQICLPLPTSASRVLELKVVVPNPSLSAAWEQITASREDAAIVMSFATWRQTAAQITGSSATLGDLHGGSRPPEPP